MESHPWPHSMGLCVGSIHTDTGAMENKFTYRNCCSASAEVTFTVALSFGPAADS